MQAGDATPTLTRLVGAVNTLGLEELGARSSWVAGNACAPRLRNNALLPPSAFPSWPRNRVKRASRRSAGGRTCTEPSVRSISLTSPGTHSSVLHAGDAPFGQRVRRVWLLRTGETDPMARQLLVEGEPIQTLVEHPSDEKSLQEKLKANPELLPVDDFGLTAPMMVVGRETRLASGAADLLGLTRTGELLIVEFKTGPQNPDFRHALAQVLDYAADLWRMTFEAFEETVAQRYFDSVHSPQSSPTHKVHSLREAASSVWPDFDDESFDGMADRLTEVLAKGAFHLVVVAQRFTPPMITTAEYLTAAQPATRLFLVELVKFTGGAVSAYEARTVYRPRHQSQAKGGAGNTSESDLLAAIPEDRFRSLLKELFTLTEELGLRLEWGSKGMSARLPTRFRPEPISVMWAFPPGLGWSGLRDLALGFPLKPVVGVPEAEGLFEQWAGTVAAVPGATPASAKNIRAWTFSPQASVGATAELKEALSRLVEVAQLNP